MASAGARPGSRESLLDSVSTAERYCLYGDK